MMPSVRVRINLMKRTKIHEVVVFLPQQNYQVLRNGSRTVPEYTVLPDSEFYGSTVLPTYQFE